MAIPVLGTLLEAGLKIIDKVIPDPAQKSQAQLELLKLQQSGEFKQIETDLARDLAQSKINEEDSKSSDPFQRRWRPAAGWVCVSGFFYMAILRPLLPWTMQVFGINAPPLPPIETELLMVLLAQLLGLGGYRTFEKVKGVA